jgi:AraC-like DNA-binding protein
MIYRRISPPADLSHIIQCFWSVQDEAGVNKPDSQRQKIIPDGFTEVIFHFGEPYRIRLYKRWETQAPALVAGQIKKHFYLENQGRSDIFGIKLKPAVLTHLFGLDMSKLTDRVVDVSKVRAVKSLAVLYKSLISLDTDRRCGIVAQLFRSQIDAVPHNHPVDAAIDLIFRTHGTMSIGEIASRTGFTERHIEQLFKKHVGLTPKFLARIVRFNRIFHLISDKQPDWSDIVFQSGFYDQSHFIRNFKAFTGEDPSRYMFSRPDLANFFLRQERTVTS